MVITSKLWSSGQKLAFKEDRIKPGWARLVPGWVTIYWSTYFNSRFSSTYSLIELFERLVRAAYCASRTVHDTKVSCVEFYPRLVPVRFLEKRSTWEGLALSANPNQLMRHIVLTVAKLPRNIGQRYCLLSINAAWKQETQHADIASRKQNYLLICWLAMFSLVFEALS